LRIVPSEVGGGDASGSVVAGVSEVIQGNRQGRGCKSVASSRPCAGTHNPCRCSVQKASAPLPKRDDTAYGSRLALRLAGTTWIIVVIQFRKPKHAFVLSRHVAPEFCKSSAHKSEGAGHAPQQRARGMPGARGTRSPCAEGSKHTVVTAGNPETPGIPCAVVLTAYTALSRATNSSCHPRRRIKGMREPGWARTTSAGLTPATGARTTRLCRTRPAHRQAAFSGMCTSAEA
jgi:hypothetical protein